MITAATALNAQDSNDIISSSKAIVEQISQAVELTEDQKTLIYRQVMTHETHLAKSKGKKDAEVDSKISQSEEMMMQNIEKIVGEEEFKKVMPLLKKSKKSGKAMKAAGSSSLKSNRE